jgi:hypothetical protein
MLESRRVEAEARHRRAQELAERLRAREAETTAQAAGLEELRCVEGLNAVTRLHWSPQRL